MADTPAPPTPSTKAPIPGEPLPSYSQLVAQLSSGDSAASLHQQQAERLFKQLIDGDSFDPQLQEPLAQLLPAFIHYCTASPAFYEQPQDPVRQFFALILQHAIHWCPRDFKPNQTYADKLIQLIEQAQRDWLDIDATATNFSAALKQFQHWQETEHKRAQMLETRLCEGELAELSLLSAQCRVIDTLNENLAHHLLPSELHSNILVLLKSELQHSIVTADTSQWQSAPFWACWQRLLPALGKIFPCDDRPIEDQQLYNRIPGVLSELERSQQINTSNPQAYSLWVEQLTQVLMHIIQKQTLDCTPLPALSYPEGYSPNATRITPALLRQSDALQQGDWLCFSGEDNQQIRCKLALKNPAADQLLFVDRTGRKLMTKSPKDLALCLSGGIAKPLTAPNLDQLLTQQLQLLHKAATAKQAHAKAQTMAQAARAVKVREAEQQAALAAAEQARQAAQAQMEQQLEARKAAARKAHTEARALAAAREQQLALQKLAQSEAAEQQRKDAQVAISELQLGAWLELQLDTSEWVRTKLSVIISSTGKYIFVDQVGRKLAEYLRDQLVELHCQGRLRIHHKGDNFEDQLAKVIRGLRKDIS
jgi:hypothetical protein